MDESGEFLSLAAHRGVDTEGLETVRISEGFSGKAARTKSFIAQHVSDLEDEERGRLLLKKGIKVVICVPLLAAGNVVGVMNLGADQVIDIDQDRIDLLISIGNQIAIAVNNARLYAELDKRVKELKAQKDATEFLAYSIPTTSRAPPWVYSASPGGSTSATATSSGTRPRSIAGRSSGLRSKS
jgi:GAF domain-containing protein